VKRRGNPNWGKALEPLATVVTPSAFEQQVRKLDLTPDQYVQSTRLREWARHNMNAKYVPEDLLKAWGLPLGTNPD
jgi:hypothetical protein